MVYWTSKHIPELAGYSIKDRINLLQQAQIQLPVPKKFILNLLSLLIISPLFFLVTFIDGWLILFPLLLVGLFIPLLTNPIRYYFLRPILINLLKSSSLKE